MELVSYNPSGVLNFKVDPRFFGGNFVHSCLRHVLGQFNLFTVNVHVSVVLCVYKPRLHNHFWAFDSGDLLYLFLAERNLKLGIESTSGG